MLVLITAAGAGERFRRAGFNTPKPAIRAGGVSLLERSLRCLPWQAGDHCCVVVQQQQRVQEQLAAELQARWPELHWSWIALSRLEPGQLATAVVALQQLPPETLEQPLVIHNCDTAFHWPHSCSTSEQRRWICAEGWDAAMPVVEADGEHWSFGRPCKGEPLAAAEIAEKRRISGLASIGLYGFARGATLLQHAQPYLKAGEWEQQEAYIAPFLQHRLEQGDRISLPRLARLEPLGTPSELASSTGLSLEALRLENAASTSLPR